MNELIIYINSPNQLSQPMTERLENDKVKKQKNC